MLMFLLNRSHPETILNQSNGINKTINVYKKYCHILIDKYTNIILKNEFPLENKNIIAVNEKNTKRCSLSKTNTNILSC